MRYEVSAVVEAPPAAVWEWWTDHGPVGQRTRVSHGLGSSLRTVVSRDGPTIVLRESMLGIPIMTHTLELHAGQLAFKESATAFTAWWRFERAAEGTRVRREVETRRWSPRALTIWAAQKDLDHHARQAEKELADHGHFP